MKLDQMAKEVISKELASRSEEKRTKVLEAGNRFDRLVKAGLVEPERYKVEPINPSSFLASRAV